MAKDFASLYATGNDSSAQEQKIFVKQEVTRGTPVVPLNTDHTLQLAGGAANIEKPIVSSPIRSGRHHRGIIRQKHITTWNYPFFWMVDTTLGAPSDAEFNLADRTIWKSILGRERDTAAVGNLTYDAVTPPDITFTILENGDQWAKQAPGSFAINGSADFPGDGESQWNAEGQSKTMYLIGIAQSNIDNDGGNTITVGSGEGQRFEVGGLVMLIESDGSTRSADTPDETARRITDITGDVITVDGAPLADADFSGSPGYLTYYEPPAPVAINNPLTGLEGTITIAGFTTDCVRSASISLENNHEVINFCYGTDSLAGALFSATDRLSVTLTLELNLNHELVEFINNLSQFNGENVNLILGESTGRHVAIAIPKWTPSIPNIPIPDAGTIPVSFTGLALESAAEAGDEITLEIK